MKHNPDRNQFKAANDPLDRAKIKSDKRHAKGSQYNRGWHGKSKPGDQRSAQTTKRHANTHADLRTGRPRHELAKCHQIGIARITQPFAARNELFTEIADMRNRTTKTGQAKTQKDQEDLPKTNTANRQ